jgi:hypothetical protein
MPILKGLELYSSKEAMGTRSGEKWHKKRTSALSLESSFTYTNKPEARREYL